MGAQTNISWTDHTWSPWLGCRKVSPGCDHCYITSTTPFRVRNIKHGSQREELSEAYWKHPYSWDRKAKMDGRRPRVFPSLCDPFDDEVPIQWLADFVKVMMETPNLIWLILTKRPQNIESRMLDAAGCLNLQWDGFPENVWLGVSAENQKYADNRIPILCRTKARVRFISAEPLLGPIDFGLYEDGAESPEEKSFAKPTERGCLIHQIIIGGESHEPGKDDARPFHAEWARDIIRQCRLARVAPFFKQAGSNCRVTDYGDNIQYYEAKGIFIGRKLKPIDWPIGTHVYDANPVDLTYRVGLKHPKGADPSEWPEDLRVQEVPV